MSGAVVIAFAESRAFAASVDQNSGILFDERTVTKGQAQRLLSVPNAQRVTSSPSTSGLTSGQNPSVNAAPSLPTTPSSPLQPSLGALPEVQSATSVQDARSLGTQPPKHTENLLDSMDVYALSPHAAQLALPRMIPQSVVQQWYVSHPQNYTHQGQVSQSHASGSTLGITLADWSAIISHASKVSGLDAALIAAVIGVESDFDAYAVSSKGAQGAMQIMPITQEELGLEDAFNPHESVEAGSRYLRKQLDRFGTVELALAAYNAGPGNVERYGGVPPFKETQNYVRKVMAAYAKSLP